MSINIGSYKSIKTEPNTELITNLPSCNAILLSPRYSKHLKKDLPKK